MNLLQAILFSEVRESVWQLEGDDKQKRRLCRPHGKPQAFPGLSTFDDTSGFAACCAETALPFRDVPESPFSLRLRFSPPLSRLAPVELIQIHHKRLVLSRLTSPAPGTGPPARDDVRMVGHKNIGEDGEPAGATSLIECCASDLFQGIFTEYQQTVVSHAGDRRTRRSSGDRRFHGWRGAASPAESV
jgi:hypothetical protein